MVPADQKPVLLGELIFELEPGLKHGRQPEMTAFRRFVVLEVALGRKRGVQLVR